MTKYILSVDGGGIRGIIPAIILAEIESRTKKPISQIFDLMAGTSTGGIVVAGLCKSNKLQYSANDLVELYQEYGPYIFQASLWRKSIASWLSGSQYSYKNMEFILNKYFGESTMADVASNLLLTSYDIHNSCEFFFKSWKEENIKLKDALRATTAAPTYFTPKRLKISQRERVLIDGGVFANNPAACAYASALSLSRMSDDKTSRGYSLPHPENIAVEDVVRIRRAIEKIDEDITEREDKHNQLKSNFERFNFETFLNFWK